MLKLWLPDVVCESTSPVIGHSIRPAFRNLFHNKKKFKVKKIVSQKSKWLNESYFYIASVLNRVSSWKQFLSGEPYPVPRPWPESVSEVSAECEFPVCLIKINVMAEVSSPTREICNSLSLSTQKWVMTDCPPWQEKAASEDFVTSRCSSNPTLSLIQWRKPTKVKAVHKVRNKDLVLPVVLGW